MMRQRLIGFLLLALAARQSHGASRGRDLSMSGLARAAAFNSADDCDAITDVVKLLTDAFPCVKDYCDGGSVQTTSPPVTTKPTSPPTGAPTTGPTVAPPPITGEIQVGTYIPNWFVYKKIYMGPANINKNEAVLPPTQGTGQLKQEYTFWPNDLASLAPKLTHLYYAFWDLDESCNVKDSDPDASWYGKGNSDPTWIDHGKNCKGLMNDMMSLKARFPHLKLLVSLGGWTYSKHFSKCAETDAGRDNIYATFSHMVKYMDADWGKEGAVWNGIDFDWEFPEAAGDSQNFGPKDWDHYVELVNSFRTRAHAEGRNAVILSSAIGVGPTLTNLVNKPAVAKAYCESLDHINLMEYDIWGKWARITGHNAPFCHDTREGNPSENLSVVGTINALGTAGCDMKKLHLGLPNYSHAWTGVPAGPHGNGLFTESKFDTEKTVDAEGKPLEINHWIGWSTFSDDDTRYIPQGVITWWDMKASEAALGLETYALNCTADQGVVVPIKHVWAEKDGLFASYEDPETITAKTQWARQKGLGGFFFWDAQQDKHGDLLDAARAGFGNLPVHNGNGNSQICFDNKKIDFNTDPSGNTKPPQKCQKTNKMIVTEAGCYATRDKISGLCGGGTPVFVGAERADGGDCITVCASDWNAGTDPLWGGDKIYYACNESEITWQ